MGPALLQVLRSYNNIEEDCTVCPSWCLRLRARGHSYCADLEHHIPQYTLDAPKVSVAPAAVGGGTGEPGFCRGLQIPLLSLMASETCQAPSLAVPTSPLPAPGALRPSRTLSWTTARGPGRGWGLDLWLRPAPSEILPGPLTQV